MIDTLADIAPGSPLDAIRAQRPQARAACAGELQFAVRAGQATPTPAKRERFAIAASSRGLHGQPEIDAASTSKFLAAGVSRPAGGDPRGRRGGRRPKDPMVAIRRGRSAPRTRRVPSTASPRRRARRWAPRLAAALEHAHMLVFHPRDAAPAYLQDAARCRMVDHRHRGRSPSWSPFSPTRSGSSPDCAS